MPWREYTEVRSEEAILKLRDHRPRGLVPSEKPVAGLLAAIDTQDTGFYYEIRAWGYGLTPDSWQVREGFVLSFDDLERILFSDEYRNSEGDRYPVQFTVIDAMGHRTKEVYDWTRRFRRRVMPLQGVDRLNQPVAYTKIDTYPGTNKAIPGGLILMRVPFVIHFGTIGDCQAVLILLAAGRMKAMLLLRTWAPILRVGKCRKASWWYRNTCRTFYKHDICRCPIECLLDKHNDQ